MELSKNIEISDFKINNKIVLIDNNEGSIVLKDTKSIFKKGQKLSFKIKAGNYLPTICHHTVGDKPNIIVKLTKAPVPNELVNIPTQLRLNYNLINLFCICL